MSSQLVVELMFVGGIVSIPFWIIAVYYAVGQISKIRHRRVDIEFSQMAVTEMREAADRAQDALAGVIASPEFIRLYSDDVQHDVHLAYDKLSRARFLRISVITKKKGQDTK